MMSTENNFTAGSPQYKWMENDLKSVNRTLTPWVVIAGHRPMYSSQMAHGEFGTYCVAVKTSTGIAIDLICTEFSRAYLLTDILTF